MTDFPYIGGIEISAIQNREFIRIETDKAQAIVVALDKSNIPFSARFGDAEMLLTYDGSYKEQVEEIIAKAQSGDYEALLRELQVYGVPDGYYRLLGEVAELLNTTVSFLQSRPDEVQLALCKTYVDFWLCDTPTLQRELDRVISVNGRTMSDIQEHEKIKEKAKAPTVPEQRAAIIFAATVIRTFQEKNINTCLRSPVADSRANRSVAFRTKKEKGSSDNEEDHCNRKCRCYRHDRSGYHHREAHKVR